MKKRSFIKKFHKILKNKLKEYILDEYGGNLLEYALLIGLALFIFFIIVGVMTSLLEWPLELSSNLWDEFGATFT